MTYSLPKLNYSFDALEPEIDAKTMEIHYSKHHQAYINNLNAALEKFPEYQNLPITKLLFEYQNLPNDLKNVVRNNGGGHANHCLFWEILSPEKNLTIPTEFKLILEANFGSVEKFKTEFENAAKTRFGSGWAWLVLTKNNELKIISTANQDSPMIDGNIPLLGLDVWEHAYYLNYQNRRPEYVSNFWKIVNWDYVNTIYQQIINSCKTCCC